MKNILQRATRSKLPGAKSEGVFLLVYRGKKFVLRTYEDETTANRYAIICKRLRGFVPNICFQGKNQLLFEYIKGRDCTKADALRVARRVGELCARIHKLRKRGSLKQLNLQNSIALFKKHEILTNEELDTAKLLYLQLKRELKPNITMDLADIYPENFRLRKGNLYLVDIECMEPKIKGSGIGKAFMKWFKTANERKQFIRGYSKIASPKFLTSEMLTFLYLNFLIGNMVHKIQRNKPQSTKNPILLRKILKGAALLRKVF